MRVFNFLLLVSASTASFLFSSISQKPAPIDCAWLPWTYGYCVRIKEGDYRREEIRDNIEAENGGKECKPGPMRKLGRIACSGEEFITSTILQSLGITRVSQLPQPSQGGRMPQWSEWTAFTLPSTTMPPCIPKLSRPPWYPTRSGYSPCVSDIPEHRPPQSRPSDCVTKFVDSASGVKLLGARCQYSRKRRQVLPFSGQFASIEHRDVLFLVDESGSVGKEKFKTELEFVRELAGKFCKQRKINAYRTRVALTTFAANYKHHINFLNHTNAGSFQSAVDTVKYRGGSTCLVKALEGVRNEMFSVSRGSRIENINEDGKREADGLVILITDGCFNCFGGNYKEELQKQQKLFEEKGIFLMTFMINVGNNCEENFQYLYDGSACFQGVSFPSWGEFQTQVNNLKKMRGCIDRWDENVGEGGGCP